LKDLNNFLTPQLVYYNHIWLNFLMDEYHFNNIAKINLKNFVPNHIDKNKNLTSFKKMDIFYVIKMTLLLNPFLRSH
jgi:hypothetical protein